MESRKYILEVAKEVNCLPYDSAISKLMDKLPLTRTSAVSALSPFRCRDPFSLHGTPNEIANSIIFELQWIEGRNEK